MRPRSILSRLTGAPPYDIMVDTIHANVGNVVGTSAAKVAGYITGSPDIAWSDADFARFPHHGVVRIDQSNRLSPIGDVKDVEQFASTNATAVSWARQRRAGGHEATIYTSESNVGDVRSAMAAAGVRGVTYWIANWSLSESAAARRLGGDVVAVQFASPETNPNSTLPGTSRTLRQTNADLSVAVPGWHPAAAPRPPKPVGPAGDANFMGYLDLKTGHWTLHGTPGKVVFGPTDKWASAEIQINVHTGEWRLRPLPWNAPPLGG